MRLISAKIENFGKLHDFTIDFDEGLNVFLRENGYGKSTLASFIRVMFYGLSGDRKTQDEENDRKKYRPWQGGSFGGELVFEEEASSKKYRIVRTFGERKGQDIFRLYDAETNLESHDYSENIGEEILKIDERSFKKTVFIGQMELETGITSEINAKIGNVSEDRDDMNRYETVLEGLKDEINAISPHRRTGSIFKKRMELEILKTELKDKELMEQELTQSAGKLHEEGDELRKLKKTIEGLNGRLVARSQYQDVINDKINYDNLIQEISGCEHRLLEAEKRYFGSLYQDMTQDMRLEKINRGLRELDDRFRCGIPDEKDLNILEKRIAKLQFLREKLGLMKENGYTGRRTKGSDGSGAVIRLTSLIIVVAALAFGGWLVISDKSTTVGLMVAVAGLVVALILTVGISGSLDSRSGANVRKSPGINEVSDEIDHLSRDIASYLHEFYPRVDFSDVRNMDFEAFGGLRNDVLRYARLCDIRDFAGELAAKRKAKADFEGCHDVEKLMNIRETSVEEESFEAMSRSLKEYSAVYNEKNEYIHSLKAHMNAVEEKLQVLYEKERSYEAGLDELNELEQRHNLMILVRDHLEKAHENFSKVYMTPLMSAFEKYYRIFINTSGLQDIPYRMDANFNIGFMAEGQAHSTQLLSEGFKNLVELARRMAFIDAMYGEEKPFIVLDDPFVNLDEVKVDGAMKFLDEISKYHQVIYFTCHESRK
ncbi:ATP-binding protein [Oribacterium sp. WCC10]|uniref:ATP-binding protein n=1 Tax=Oribacterium sp. WCC10 TaxID=1855343 RepID=UPI0008E1BB20|nr:ATP-binding protein [Oribacterium sp. WCC10]SFG34649.1 AAA domain-containing protein [Oribacterium sp. WCC10]